MSNDPLLWYLNRSTGLVLLVALTASTALGVLALGGRSGGGLPRFVTQSLHRNLALVSVTLLAAHVVSAVADSFVDIRWWQAVVPFGATYRPLWLGLGALSLDLVAVVVVTSLLRARMGHRAWHGIHLAAWACWVLAVGHGLGIGTDLGLTPADLFAVEHRWATLPTAVCVGVMLGVTVVRLWRGLWPGTDPEGAR